MVHYHLPHIPHLHPFHLRLHPPLHVRLSQGAQDSLWLFAALAIMIAVASLVQVLFSML